MPVARNRHKPLILFAPQSPDGQGGDCRLPWELFESRCFQDEFQVDVLAPETKSYRGLADKLKGVCRFIFFDRHRSPIADAFDIVLPPIGRRIRNHAKSRFVRSGTQFDCIERLRPALVWFNLSSAWYTGFHPGMERCRRLGIPYWYVANNVPNELVFYRDWRDSVTHNLVGAARVLAHSKEGLKLLKRAALADHMTTQLLMTSRSDQFLARAGDIATEHPVKTEGPARFVHVGSFDPHVKGQHMLLSALAGRKWRDRDWSLRFAGHGQSAYLEDLVVHLGLEDRVGIVGFREDVLSLHVESDVFFFPSLTEGKGLALIEAMAAGRPALGTPIGGIKEVIKDQRNGWLASAASTRAVADCLERMWQDRPLWPAFGRQARVDVSEEYNHERAFPKLVSALLQDLRGDGRDTKKRSVGAREEETAADNKKRRG